MTGLQIYTKNMMFNFFQCLSTLVYIVDHLKIGVFFVSLEPSLCDAKRDQGIPPASLISESSTSTRDLERDVMGKKEMDITSRNVPHPKRQV